MNTFGKKSLLLATFALGLTSTVPTYAMDTANMDNQVREKTGFFSGWSVQALRTRLDTEMKKLDKQWAHFNRCLKGGKDCSPAQRAVATSLVSILAIVSALSLWKGIRSIPGIIQSEKDKYEVWQSNDDIGKIGRRPFAPLQAGAIEAFQNKK